MHGPPLPVWVGLTILLGTLVLVILVCRRWRRRVYLSAVRSLLTAAEARFYKVLQRAVPEGCVLLAKVRIADIIQVTSRHPPSRHRVFRSISSKHVDFLLADALTFEPLAAIELDDSSHARRDRRKRDELVERIFTAAGLPLIRIPTAARYSAGQLAAALEEQVGRPVTRRERF
ncbi:MAG TPA: DUF2726 domain-containing protein [Chthoniobacterales bacterium]